MMVVVSRAHAQLQPPLTLTGSESEFRLPHLLRIFPSGHPSSAKYFVCSLHPFPSFKIIVQDIDALLIVRTWVVGTSMRGLKYLPNAQCRACHLAFLNRSTDPFPLTTWSDDSVGHDALRGITIINGRKSVTYCRLPTTSENEKND
jgi:hypothetical protein